MNLEQFIQKESIQMVGLVECSGTGTKVLQSFLDGHPNLLTIPSYPLVYFYPHWFEWTSQKTRSWPELLELFCVKHASVLDSARIPGHNGLNNVGEGQDESLKIDEDIFRKTFLELTEGAPLSSRNMILAVHLAFARAQGQDIRELKVILYHIHNDIYLEHLKADFPHLKVIGMYRDPRANSLNRVETGFRVDEEKLSLTDAFLHRKFVFANLCHYYFKNIFDISQYVVPENLIIIRHEDLYHHLDFVLKWVCQWLGIPFHESLNTMTFSGKKWWGDKIYGKKLDNKVSSSVVSEKWKNILKPREIFIIEATSFEVLKRFGFPLLAYNDTWKDRLKFLFLGLLPMRYEAMTFHEYLDMKLIDGYFKNILREMREPEVLKDYTFNAAYKHKWDYKRQNYWKRRRFVTDIQRGKEVSTFFSLYYALERIVALFKGFVQFPYVLFLRYRIMYGLFFKRLIQGPLKVPPLLTIRE